MPCLEIITVSTREGRKGVYVADWFETIARQHGKFDLEAIDLREIDLPMFDEPNHPSQQKYQHEHTRRWSEIVMRADAYVFVTPEYNNGSPPSLLNAIDYLNKEWMYKPAGFVSYGGVSGGTRSVQMTKQVLTTLNVMPIPDAVSIPFFSQYINQETGGFDPGEVQVKAANKMLDSLLKWSMALREMRM